MCVFETDADFSRSCFVEGGKKHRPDMVIDNAFDDNVKIVFRVLNRLCVTQEECLGFHYFHRGQTTTGRLSPNTNTAEGTLTQESGDVRSVEGEVCGAVLVDE